MSNNLYTKKNVYKECSENVSEQITAYGEGYKKFLDNSKTERDAVKTGIAMAKANGYSEYKIGDKIKVGDKKYLNNREKSLYLFKVGQENLEETGIRIMAAHIDSPRLDLKQVPLYEDSDLAFFKTHYYGGVKKYQWTTIPLALHGVVVKENGEVVDIQIGESEDDPIFYISDLLPHLGKKQSEKTLGEAITGEELNIWVGGMPLKNEKDNPVKENVLKILNNKYGITEEDLISAELTMVPAYKAKDVGFDRAQIAGYGHDDKVCAYPEITAMFDTETNKTVIAVIVDKEEIGSEGSTGMQCELIKDLITEISIAKNANERIVRGKSMCLSADVTAAFDPNFKDVYEKNNSSLLSAGGAFCKFTGARGKSGSSDASAEYVAYIRGLLNKKGINWQMAELGKVDEGGGGTVAKYIANMNIDTLDFGVPVISMHSPYELISKADLYASYLAFCEFVK